MADWYVSPAGSDSTGTGTSGNPYATPGKAGSVMAGGDTLYIKYNSSVGAYNPTSATANVAGGYLDPPSGTAATPTRVIGYNSTIGDLDDVYNWSNFPTLQNSASGNTTTMRLTNNFINVRNLIIDSNGATSGGGYGLYVPGSNIEVVNCKFINTTGGTPGAGLYIGGTKNIFRRCWASNNKYGFNHQGSICFFIDCVATGNGQSNAGAGFAVLVVGAYSIFTHCLSYANLGTAVDGFMSQSQNMTKIVNCVSHGNGRHGIVLSGTNATASVVIMNSIMTSNGQSAAGYGLTSDTTTLATSMCIDNNFYYNNNSANYNTTTLPFLPATHDATLTGLPFNNAAGGDFSLNNVAGQGAAVRGSAYPGTYPGGLTVGYLDGGVAQHQDSGGGSTVYIISQTINRYYQDEDA